MHGEKEIKAKQPMKYNYTMSTMKTVSDKQNGLENLLSLDVYHHMGVCLQPFLRLLFLEKFKGTKVHDEEFFF